MVTKRVLSVGQCGADHGSISWAMKTRFGADVISAETASEALATLGSNGFALVLVNRLLDADGTSGLELIKAMKADDALKVVPVMLVSNYEDAQAEAVAAGAVPGFGKGQLRSVLLDERVKPYLG